MTENEAIEQMKGDLEYWRERFRTTQSEYSAQQCEKLYKEMEDFKKMIKETA